MVVDNDLGKLKTDTQTIEVTVVQPAQTNPGATEGSVTHNKTVTKTGTTAAGDEKYDLALTFSGTKKNFTKKQDVDVVFVVDVSGSMDPIG
jgi:Mg-chelatase subunit ChlD